MGKLYESPSVGSQGASSLSTTWCHSRRSSAHRDSRARPIASDDGEHSRCARAECVRCRVRVVRATRVRADDDGWISAQGCDDALGDGDGGRDDDVRGVERE